MKTIALTGSIGMGKSTVAAMFVARGVPLFDADAAVHKLYQSGPLVAAIEARFCGTTGPNGVDRAKLAPVLNDPQAIAALEAIVHPAVAEARAEFIARHRSSGLILFDIPLLFETGAESGFDAVIVVSAPPAIQRARVLARPGMTPTKFDSIIARQMPDADKRARADHVIDTGASLAATAAQVDRILACIAGDPGR